MRYYAFHLVVSLFVNFLLFERKESIIGVRKFQGLMYFAWILLLLYVTDERESSPRPIRLQDGILLSDLPPPPPHPSDPEEVQETFIIFTA